MTPANRFVPYSFARDNAILLVPKSERDAEVWIRTRRRSPRSTK